MQVKDIMIPVVDSVTPETTLREASEKIKALDIDPLPVCEDGRIVGLVTEQAMMARAAQDLLATGSVPVSDVMDREVVCCSLTESVSEALGHLEDALHGQARGRVPVTDSEGKLAGIVSLADLRTHATDRDAGESAVEDVASVDQLVQFSDDRVDYMSDASFPASDPPPMESPEGSRGGDGGR